jgi:hypothetical protein
MATSGPHPGATDGSRLRFSPARIPARAPSQRILSMCGRDISLHTIRAAVAKLKLIVLRREAFTVRLHFFPSLDVNSKNPRRGRSVHRGIEHAVGAAGATCRFLTTMVPFYVRSYQRDAGAITRPRLDAGIAVADGALIGPRIGAIALPSV